jgi:hypothetical protein
VATSTVKSAGGDYSSLSAWEAAKQAVLSATEEAECYDFADTTPTTIVGWTTSATNYIRIYTPTAERHDGTTGTGYRLQTNGFESALTVTEENVRVEGIELYSGTNHQDMLVLNAAGTCDIRVSHCLFSAQAMTAFDIISGSAGTGTWKIWNNFFVKSMEYAVNWDPGGGTLYFYNNSMVGCGREAGGYACFLRVSGTVVAKNNIADERTTSGSNSATSGWSGTFDAGSTKNLSTDTTDAGTDTINSATPVYVNVGGNNIKLDATDTACKDVGADLSADANIAVSDDIVGTARPSGSAFDIGAFEIVQAGGGGISIPVVYHHRQRNF